MSSIQLVLHVVGRRWYDPALDENSDGVGSVLVGPRAMGPLGYARWENEGLTCKARSACRNPGTS